jgi:pimeloyl-ACP methyl ester carboxylesterase
MFATLNNQRFWYERHGDHGSPVVLVMGFGISGRAWAPQVEALKQHHRVLIFDNRGIGESESSKTPYGFSDLAADTTALMTEVGFDDAHVVGVSMGGMIAQHAALRFPERLRSLNLIATFPGGGLRHATPSLRAVRLFVRANTSRGAARIAALRELLYTESFLAHTEPTTSFGTQHMEVFAVPADTTTRLNQLRAVFRHDVTKALGAVSTPTLIIKPERDLLVKPENSERLHALIPGSRIVRLADAGHGATHQAKDAVNAALLEHFAAVDAKRAGTAA